MCVVRAHTTTTLAAACPVSDVGTTTTTLVCCCCFLLCTHDDHHKACSCKCKCKCGSCCLSRCCVLVLLVCLLRLLWQARCKQQVRSAGDDRQAGGAAARIKTHVTYLFFLVCCVGLLLRRQAGKARLAAGARLPLLGGCGGVGGLAAHVRAAQVCVDYSCCAAVCGFNHWPLCCVVLLSVQREERVWCVSRHVKRSLACHLSRPVSLTSTIVRSSGRLSRLNGQLISSNCFGLSSTY